MSSGIAGDHQRSNASVAVHLTRTWSGVKLPEVKEGEGYGVLKCDSEDLTPEERKGLTDCRWPGRSQKLELGRTTYYIDGAHTKESCECVVRWLIPQLPPRSPKSVLVVIQADAAMNVRSLSKPECVILFFFFFSRNRRVLIFDCTGDRDPRDLLRPVRVLGTEGHDQDV